MTFNHSHRGWWQRRAPSLSACWTSAGTTTRSRRQPSSTASWFWRSSRRWSSSRRSRTVTSQLHPALASMSSRKHTGWGAATCYWTSFFFFLLWSQECERTSQLNVTFLPNDPNITPFLLPLINKYNIHFNKSTLEGLLCYWAADVTFNYHDVSLEEHFKLIISMLQLS